MHKRSPSYLSLSFLLFRGVSRPKCIHIYVNSLVVQGGVKAKAQALKGKRARGAKSAAEGEEAWEALPLQSLSQVGMQDSFARAVTSTRKLFWQIKVDIVFFIGKLEAWEVLLLQPGREGAAQYKEYLAQGMCRQGMHYLAQGVEQKRAQHRFIVRGRYTLSESRSSHRCKTRLPHPTHYSCI